MKKSFRTRMLISIFIPFFLTTCCMISTITIINYTYQREDINNDIKARHEKLDDTFNYIVEDANSLGINMTLNETLNGLNESDDKNTALTSFFLSQPVSFDLILGVSIQGKDTTAIQAVKDQSITLPEIPKSERENLLNYEDANYSMHYILSTFNDSASFLVMGKKATIGTEEKGLFFFLNGDRLQEIVNSTICYDKSFIIDSNRNIVLSSDEKEMGSVIFNGAFLNLNSDEYQDRVNFQNEDVYLSLSTLNSLKRSYNLSWKVVSMQDYSSLFGTIELLTEILVILTCFFFLFALCFSFFYSKRVSKPLKTLSNKLITTDLEEPKVENKPVEMKDEIAMLESSYDQMVLRIKELLDENMRKKDEQRILELDALQMQINPHFLYNTLDTISWMAKINGEKEIDALVMSLSKLFRLTLHSGDKIIKVKEEIELTKHYLEIQAIRFPERFSYSFEVDKEIEECLTLKLLLEPIVENSIKYAFDPKKGKLNISIKAKRERGDIIFSIEDDGIGFVVDDTIFAKKPLQGEKTGFGLYNVSERIALEYGATYGLRVESIIDKGTLTTIKIPLLN